MQIVPERSAFLPGKPGNGKEHTLGEKLTKALSCNRIDVGLALAVIA